MKKMMVLTLVLVLTVGMLVACGTPKQDEKIGDDVKTSQLELTSADNGKTIEVAIGAMIKLTLPENQTTPVHWQDPPKTEGDLILSDITSEYITDPNPEGRMGVGGVRVYKFDVKSAGTVKLILIATHVSDPNDVYDKFDVTLTAK